MSILISLIIPILFRSRQNAPDIEAAFYRDQSLCRHLENVHGLEHDLEYVQSLGTID